MRPFKLRFRPIRGGTSSLPVIFRKRRRRTRLVASAAFERRLYPAARRREGHLSSGLSRQPREEPGTETAGNAGSGQSNGCTPSLKFHITRPPSDRIFPP